MKPIYLDYAATTPVAPSVIARMMAFMGSDSQFGNPASRSHVYGWLAEEAVELARRQVADLVGVDPREIVWTSGATESDNLAIKGAAFARQTRGKHIVTVQTEHKAVIDTCRWLEGQGFRLTYVEPESDGTVSLERIDAALEDDTILVSVMHANNETGVLSDIAAIGVLCRARGILFHVDAAQTAGKIVIDLAQLSVDLMSFSAHKIYGPKGIGALYVRRSPEVEIAAQMHGGGHERGYRSGTLASHQIVGMGEAFALASQSIVDDFARLTTLRQRLWSGLSALDDVHLNGHADKRLPGHINVAFDGVNGELLLTSLSDIAVSSGSACTSASLEPSYVLKAMGLSDALANSSIRFAIGRETSAADIEKTIEHVVDKVRKLRG